MIPNKNFSMQKNQQLKEHKLNLIREKKQRRVKSQNKVNLKNKSKQKNNNRKKEN